MWLCLLCLVWCFRIGSSLTALPDFPSVLSEAMDSARLQMLQELMKEARSTGELESSLAATSVMPMPKRPTRKNVPLADFNQTVANMAKPSACVQPSGIQSPGIQAPGIQAVPKSTLLANVAASSNAPPMSQGPMPLPMPQTSVPLQTKQVSTAATNPETSQGINRMRLAHERGDPLPTVEEAKVQRAKAAIFRSNLGQTVDPQVVAKALATPVEAPGLSYPPGPGYRPAGYVKPDPPATLNKRNRVTRQPVQVSFAECNPWRWWGRWQTDASVSWWSCGWCDDWCKQKTEISRRLHVWWPPCRIRRMGGGRYWVCQWRCGVCTGTWSTSWCIRIQSRSSTTNGEQLARTRQYRWKAPPSEYPLSGGCDVVWRMGQNNDWIRKRNARWVLLCRGPWCRTPLCTIQEMGSHASWKEISPRKGLHKVSGCQRTLLWHVRRRYALSSWTHRPGKGKSSGKGSCSS